MHTYRRGEMFVGCVREGMFVGLVEEGDMIQRKKIKDTVEWATECLVHTEGPL